MKILDVQKGMKVFNTVSMLDETVICVNIENNSVITVDCDGFQEEYSCKALSASRDSLEELYKDILCPMCRTLLIQKAIYNDNMMSIQDHYGNTVKVTPVYCPMCGCNFNDKYK